MKHYYLFAKVNKKATGKHIFELCKQKGFSDYDLMASLYEENEKSDEFELTRTTIYNWKNGTYIPDLHRLFLLSKLFNLSIEEIVIYDIDFILGPEKKSDKNISGIKIHSSKKEITFYDDLPFDEIRKKYKKDFDYFINTHLNYIYSKKHTVLTNENDRDNKQQKSIQNYNFSKIKENLKNEFTKTPLTNKEIKTIMNTSDQRVSAWRRGINKPETEKLLELANLFEITLSDLCL